MIIQAQKEAMMAGLTDPSKIYNGLTMLINAMGRKDTDQFFSNPADPNSPKPPPQPPPPEVQAAEKMVQVEQIKQQGAAQKMQAEMQADAQKTQAQFAFDADQAEKDRQLKIAIRKMELEFEAGMAADSRMHDFQKTEFSAALGRKDKALDFKTQFEADALAKRVDENGELVEAGPSDTDKIAEALVMLASMLQPKPRKMTVQFNNDGTAEAVSVPLQ